MSSQTTTQVVYTGHDNIAQLTLTRYDGRRRAPLDFSAVERMILTMPEVKPEPYVFDSLLSPGAIDWSVGGGVVRLNLSDYDIPPGVQVISLVAFSPDAPSGEVLIDSRPSRIGDQTFVEFRQIAGGGFTPPPIPAVPIEFAYGDASPRVIQSLRKKTLVVSVQAVITEAFDGVGASIQVKTSGDQVLLGAAYVDVTAEMTFESTPGLVLPSGTDILLVITPGEGATAGAGYIVINRG